jgi:hypothetical protein
MVKNKLLFIDTIDGARRVLSALQKRNRFSRKFINSRMLMSISPLIWSQKIREFA